MLIVLATLGMMMMVSANDLIALYLGLELQSLALYVVAAINRDSVRSTEAGLKYFVLGALSSGMLLYGASLVYGFTGQTDVRGHRRGARRGGASLGLVFGLVFLIAGLRLQGLGGAVPHVDARRLRGRADAGHRLLRRGAQGGGDGAVRPRRWSARSRSITHDWQQIIAFISILSMVLGAFAAIGQPNIKRLMAYSSIGHMGYALVGLAAGTQAGVQGVLIYMLIYVAMTLGTFACILAMRRGDEHGRGHRRSGRPVANQSDDGLHAGDAAVLARRHSAARRLLRQVYVFLAAVEAGLYVLAVIGVLASVVGAYYYLRIVKIMYFDEPAGGFAADADPSCAWSLASAAPSSCSSSSSPARSAAPRSLPRRPSSRRWRAVLPARLSPRTLTTACRPPMRGRLPLLAPASPAGCG